MYDFEENLISCDEPAPIDADHQELVTFKPTAPTRSGLKCIDLFSGAGGLAVGFRQAGWNILAANDINVEAGKTFRLNFPEAFFLQGPIGLINPVDLMKACGIVPGELDALIGGPPCQSFSYNNHHRTADDERARLFDKYLNIVEALAPKCLVMENVPGILTIGGGKVISEILSRLKDLGYNVEFTILSADEFGTPQVRRRVFIVATRVGLAGSLIPEPTHRSAKKASGDESALLPPVTIKASIGDLPHISNGGGGSFFAYDGDQALSTFQESMKEGSDGVYNHFCHNLTSVNLNRIKHVPQGGNWRNIPFDLLTAGMKRAKPSDHTKRYGRLAWDGLASTLLTKCDPHWGAYVHPTADRTISVREAARLQGFPDSFHFAGEALSIHYEQVGNAVPVPVAFAFGQITAAHLQNCSPQQSSELV